MAKLAKQTRGPVSLYNIDFAASLSEETNAFTATVSIVVDGKTLAAHVRNDGHGGSTFVDDGKVRAALDAYGATLPPFPADPAHEWSKEIPFDNALLVDCMLDDAITAYYVALDAKRDARQDAKMFAKGFRFKTLYGARILFTRVEPTQELLATKGVGPFTTTPLLGATVTVQPWSDAPSTAGRSIKIGDRVRFGRSHGEQTVGTVTKVNVKTVKVKTDTGRGSGGATTWNVALSLITHV